jgi:hypothetical protein
METEDNNMFTNDQVGKEFTIVANTAGHQFEIGETVTLVRLDKEGGSKFKSATQNLPWWCNVEDVKMYTKKPSQSEVIDIISQFIKDKAEEHDIDASMMVIRSFVIGEIHIDEIESVDPYGADFGHLETLNSSNE